MEISYSGTFAHADHIPAVAGEEAGKLIFIGQQREKEETFAPPPQSREHSQEQENPAPEKKAPEKTPGKSAAKKGNAPEKARDYDDDIPF